MTITPSVSVIIPVLDDPERLRGCLRALDDQTYPEGSYEIIVVDNGSEREVEPLLAGFERVRVVREERLLGDAARNAGLEVAGGGILAFTDADCLPEPDWIERGVAKLLGTPNCGLVADRVDVFPRDPHRPTAVELYENLAAFPQKTFVEALQFGATANLFTPRSVFDDVGPFDEGRRSGGDYEWGRRVYASGYELVYADDARVRHPARQSFGRLYQKVARTVGGDRGSERGAAYFIRGLVPPVRAVARIFSDDRLIRTTDKLKVALVVLTVRYMAVWERLRSRLTGAKGRT